MLSSWSPLRADQFMDAVQTTALVVVAALVAYAIHLLRTELKGAANILRDFGKTQEQLLLNVRRAWERIDAIEMRQGIKGDVDTFIRMKRLLDAIENPPPPPPPPVRPRGTST